MLVPSDAILSNVTFLMERKSTNFIESVRNEFGCDPGPFAFSRDIGAGFLCKWNPQAAAEWPWIPSNDAGHLDALLGTQVDIIAASSPTVTTQERGETRTTRRCD